MKLALLLLLLSVEAGCASAPKPKPATDHLPPVYQSGKHTLRDCARWAGSNFQRYQACMDQYYRKQG
jgi:hypothetical protein